MHALRLLGASARLSGHDPPRPQHKPTRLPELRLQTPGVPTSAKAPFPSEVVVTGSRGVGVHVSPEDTLTPTGWRAAAGPLVLLLRSAAHPSPTPRSVFKKQLGTRVSCPHGSRSKRPPPEGTEKHSWAVTEQSGGRGVQHREWSPRCPHPCARRRAGGEASGGSLDKLRGTHVLGWAPGTKAACRPTLMGPLRNDDTKKEFALAGVSQWINRVSSWKPKGLRFDSQSGHRPGLQAR